MRRKLSARHLAQVPRFALGERIQQFVSLVDAATWPARARAAGRDPSTDSSISSAKHVTGNSPVTHAASRRFATASVAGPRFGAGRKSDSSCEGSAQSASRRPRRRKLTSSLYDFACARVNDRGVTSRTSGGRRMSDLSVRMVDRRSNAPRRASASARTPRRRARRTIANSSPPRRRLAVERLLPLLLLSDARSPLTLRGFSTTRAPPFAFPAGPRGGGGRWFLNRLHPELRDDPGGRRRNASSGSDRDVRRPRLGASPGLARRSSRPSRVRPERARHR